MSEFDAVIWTGTGILALAFLPIAWFVLDYGIITPIKHRHDDSFEPWWTSGIGWMWFGLGAAMMLTTAVVLFSRIVGAITHSSDWAGREWLTLAVYTIVATVILLTVFVYAVEKRTPGLVLMNRGRRRREHAREMAALEHRAAPTTGPVQLVR